MSGGGGKGGGGDTQTSTVKTEPWSGLQPYLTDVYGQAAANYRSDGPQYYPGATVSPFSPQQQMAMDLTTGRALRGSGLSDWAQKFAKRELKDGSTGYTGDGTFDNALAGTMRGDYLSPDSNPWLGGIVQRAQDAVMPGINATFAGSGRTGSGMHEDNLVEGLGNISSNMYGQAYDQERNRQMGALNLYSSNYNQDASRDVQLAGMAPVLNQMDYMDFDRLMGVGNMVQGQGQNLMNASKDRWDFYNTGAGSPTAQLANYAGILAGQPAANAAGTQQQTQPMYGNDPFTNILGAGMMMLPYFI